MDRIPDTLAEALAGRYRIERELGRGGMATVYLAEDLKHHRKVALKVLRPELAAALGPDRFLREIELTAQLNHPHILPLLDSGDAEGFPYYVMPYVEGESLRERTDRETQLPVDEAIRITQQVASALDFAHRQDVIHRDIKPENILLHEGEAMVADFGIALAVSAAGRERLTETGLSLGTPAYMSPEQVSGDREIDARSDVYSLACVLYEMLAGEPPFTGPNPRAVLARHVTDAVPPITTVRSSVSHQVAAAIAKALGKAPADRFESARAFADALAAEAPAETKSIVVLPFENLSPDPDNAFFADGLTEELIADLSKVRALRVISRTSAALLKGSGKDVPTIARDMKVRYVLEGSVRRAGDNLRITAQLIDGTTDTHLWAEKYSGTLEDVFDLQENLSRRIVNALQVSLTADEDRRLAARPIPDVQAYDAWLRARESALTLTKEGIEHAFELTNQALELAGDNALLYATLAWLHVAGYSHLTIAEQDPLARAEAYATKALALAPDLAWGHYAMGAVRLRQGNLQEFVRYAKRSVALERDSFPLAALGYYLAEVGRTEEARRYAEEALALDPLTFFKWSARVVVDILEGRFSAAVDRLHQSIERLEPGGAYPSFWLGYALACAGKESGALAAFEEGMKAEQTIWTIYSELFVRALRGDRKPVEALPHASPLAKSARRWGHGSCFVACYLTRVGNTTEALRWLEHAIGYGFTNHRYMSEFNPFLAPLRGDPRFEALMERARR